jgi:hypothetical protein
MASGSNSDDTNSTGVVTQWGWNFGLTNPTIATPWPTQANYFSENGSNDAAMPHWTVAMESEDGPGNSAPGPADQSFPITDISKNSNADPGVATLQVVPGAGGRLSVDLKTNLYDNAQPAGAGYFTWYAFGENVDLGGGPLPPPDIATFDVNLLYNAWLPNAGARVSVDYQGWWNNQSFEFEIDLNRQSADWGTNTGALVQNVQQRPGLTFVQLNGAALGLDLIPGVQTDVHVNWGSIIATLISQGVIAAPVGGWSNSAGQAAYVSTELYNQTAAQAGIADVWINGFEVSSSTAPTPSTLTQVGGDTMFSVVTGSAGPVEINSRTGDIVQTLPMVSSATMQFISVDNVTFGTNLASAESLGLDPSQLCDYNGNHLGANGQWTLLGLASVQPGAAPSYILVDPTTGRWAEVAVQSNGSINFQNFGQNGDTRVVGIYIDPLIALGQVVAGGPTDSQQRFLGDVEHNNLSLLGSVYDQQNGGMDLMFAVNNSPGIYLRAILHTDGNIQYANYMNATQLSQWATSADISTTTTGAWLAKG